MYFAINELSIEKTDVDNSYKARLIINDFVSLCRELEKNGLIEVLFFPEDIDMRYLWAEYGFRKWLGDKEVSMTHKQFFHRFLDKHRGYYSSNETEGDFRINIHTECVTSIGCAFAYEHDQMAVSLPTREIWKKDVILGKYIFLNSEGGLLEKDCDLANINSILSVEKILSTYREEVFDGITSGQDLWDAREELFPNLILCGDVKEQLYKDSEMFHINAVIKKLKRLQEYFSNCSSIYDPKELGLDARTESDTVKTDPSLSSLRLFRTPNGEEKYFFDHIGFNGKYSGGRIYFHPDNANQRCYIGYIGRHLPTGKF